MSDTPESQSQAPATPANSLTRRKFLRSGAATGTALHLVTSKSAFAQTPSDTMNIGVVGCGAQGTAIRDSIYKDADDKEIAFRFTAVCDIYPEKQKRFSRTLQKYGHPATVYEDIDQMLAKEKNLDAVFVATPDFLHAPHSIAVLETENIKGVYCEKMMSNTIEGGRSMVKAQERTGKLFQVGHQRRSNPRYLHVRNKLIQGNKILGRLNTSYAQWNRQVSKGGITVPDKFNLDPEKLKKYGYANMQEFLNWRVFKKYGAGAISDLGAHQIDVFNWMYDALPSRVVASGGRDYYEDTELPDNVFAVYEYDLPEGKSRGSYQVLTANSSQGFYEKFMGEKGTISISEVPKVNQAYREPWADSWSEYGEGDDPLLIKYNEIHNKIWEHPRPWTRPEPWLDSSNIDSRVAASAAIDEWELPITLNKPPHNPHIRNFLTAVKNGGNQSDLNCPVDEAFKTCVTVLKIYEALENGGSYDFKKEDFIA